MHNAPFSVAWLLTKRCNLTCTHCFNYASGELPVRGDNELTYPECTRIADQLAAAGVFAISFIGGEPLSLKWFPDLIRHCEKAGIRTMASSNGTLLTSQLARTLSGHGLQQLQLSLDGASASLHDRIRGDRSFAAVMRATEICHQSGIEPSYAFTLMSDNVGELDALLSLCLTKQVRRLKLQLYIPSGRGTDAPISPAVLADAVMRCREFETRHPGALRIEYPCFTGHEAAGGADTWRPHEPATHLSCGAGTTRAVIFEDGSVGGCEFMREDTAADLRTTDFLELWNSKHPALEQWRRLDLVTGKCGACGYRAACGYGCRAFAYFVGGNFFGTDTSCIATPPAGVPHPYDQMPQDRREAEDASSPKRRPLQYRLRVLPEVRHD